MKTKQTKTKKIKNSQFIHLPILLSLPCMADSDHLCILILLIIICFSIPFSDADPRVDIVARSCESTKVQHVDTYFKNYATILDNMKNEMYRNKFSISEAGKPPDKLYVLSQCLDDLSNLECAQCFEKIGNLLPGCFPSTGGRVYLDGCFIRATNYSFYREIITDGDMKVSFISNISLFN